MLGKSGNEEDEALDCHDDGLHTEIQAQIDPKVERFVEFLRFGF